MWFVRQQVGRLQWVCGVGRIHPLDNTASINYTLLGEQFGGIVPNSVPHYSFKPAISALFYCYLYTEYGSNHKLP